MFVEVTYLLLFADAHFASFHASLTADDQLLRTNFVISDKVLQTQ
jgi:hypothetical protein